MVSTRLYHTVENRENPDFVERSAPFKCKRRDAWLGEGYYFWEGFIQYAHEWGEKVHNGNYFVCGVKCEYETDNVLDLLGSMEQIKEFGSIVDKLEKELGRPITVPFVIKFMKKHTSFDYQMIRAQSEACFCNVDQITIPFNTKYKSSLNLAPIVQCCVIDKSILRLPMRIEYPEKYT